MRIGCCEACACLNYCWDVFKTSFSAVILTSKEIATDPDALQKACVLGHSIIHGYNLCFQTNHFPHFVDILDHSQTFDFYGFCRVPYYFLHPYSHERIDEKTLLDNLEVILCGNWQSSSPNAQVRDFAKGSLTSFLKTMAEEEMAFSSENEFKEFLQNWMYNACEQNSSFPFDATEIHFEGLIIPLHQSEWLVILIDAAFIVADVACVPDFLNQWGLIRLSIYSEKIGLQSFLIWLPFESLDDFVRSALCVGFALKFLQAFLILNQTDDYSTEINLTKWVLAASLAEFLYNATILKKSDPRIITFFAFCAKLLGLICFMQTPEPRFFIEG